jgi:hypothetical protein
VETKITPKDLTPRETAIEMLKREVAKGIPAGGGFAPGLYSVEFMGVGDAIKFALARGWVKEMWSSPYFEITDEGFAIGSKK